MFGVQWDQYTPPPGLLWFYWNVPHEATGEKPSYLLFGIDLRSPTEALVMPPEKEQSVWLDHYCQEPLSSARETAARSIQEAQKRYKMNYDEGYQSRVQAGTVDTDREESSRGRKLSRPYHVLSVRGPNIVVAKVYFPNEGQIHSSTPVQGMCLSKWMMTLFIWYNCMCK